MPTLWPFAPADTFGESLQWRADVLPAYSSEQRVRLLNSPRQSLHFTHRMTHRAYERAKLLMQSVAGGTWYVGLWHERQRVTVSAGAGSVTVDTTASDYRAGGYALLWQSDALCEVVTIASKSGSSLTLSGTTANAYTSGLCMPCRVAYAPDGIEASHSAGPIVEAQVEFTVFDTVDLSDSGLYSTYRSHPLVSTASVIGTGSITERVQQEVGTVDNGLAAPFFDTALNRVTRALGLAWLCDTLAELWALRTFLHSRYGRQKGFWLPDWTQGITLAANISPSNTTITIVAIGLNNVAESGDILIKSAAGVLTTLQYTSVAPSGANEVLTLSGTAGITLTTEQVGTICLLRFCRLAQDRIEFEHTNTGDGLISRAVALANEVPIP